VTDDVKTAVREFKAGKIEYRNDAAGNVQAAIGKLSFSEDDLQGQRRRLHRPHQVGEADDGQGDLHPERVDLPDDGTRHRGGGGRVAGEKRTS
jgi:hypothetical protein